MSSKAGEEGLRRALICDKLLPRLDASSLILNDGWFQQHVRCSSPLPVFGPIRLRHRCKSIGPMKQCEGGREEERAGGREEGEMLEQSFSRGKSRICIRSRHSSSVTRNHERMPTSGSEKPRVWSSLFWSHLVSSSLKLQFSLLVPSPQDAPMVILSDENHGAMLDSISLRAKSH